MSPYWNIFLDGLTVGIWLIATIHSISKKEIWWTIFGILLIALYLHTAVNGAEKVLCAIQR